MRLVLAMNLPYFGRPGGALKCNRRLLQALAAAGHQVSAIVPWFGSGAPKRSRARTLDQLRADGVPVREGDGVDVIMLAGVEVHAVADPARLRGELIRAIRAGRPERASGRLATHVLDVLLGIRDAAATGSPVQITSTVPPIPPLPEDWDPTTPR